MVEAAEILQCRSVAQLVLVLQGSKRGSMRSRDPRTLGSRAAHPETPAPLPSPTDLPSAWGAGDTHLCLHHGRPLRPQGLHRLEHDHHPLVAHPLQHNAECDKHACAPNPSAVQREQEVPLETCQPQRVSAELLGAMQAHGAQGHAQWSWERPQGPGQPEVPSQPHGAHRFCLASGPSCCGTLPSPRTLPRSHRSVPSGRWANIITWQKGCQWHPWMLPPPCPLCASCQWYAGGAPSAGELAAARVSELGDTSEG